MRLNSLIRTNRVHEEPGRATSKRGGALVVSMVFVTLVAGMGVCMVQMHTAQSRRQEVSLDRKRAIYIAEAGLAEAFLSVAQGKSGNIASADEPAIVGDGLYWVEAEQLEESKVSLVSTGLSGRGRFSINTVLQRQNDPVASLGVFAESDVTVGKDSILDGYHSGKGSFDSQVNPDLGIESTGRGARVQSGEDVILEGAATGGRQVVGVGGEGITGTTVYGSVTPGPNGAVSTGSGVTITGPTAPSESSPALSEIDVPDLNAGSIPDFGRKDSVIIEAGDYDYGSLSVPADKNLTIVGPSTIVTDQLLIADGGTLTINNERGLVKVYVTERLQFASGSTLVNVAEDPTRFVLMVAADEWLDFDGDMVADNPVEFMPDGKFYGYVFAPTVDFDLTAETHLIGGVAANTVTLAEGSRMTYDFALAATQVAVAGLPMQVAWTVTEIPDEPICRSHLDPKTYLDVNGITPLKSADAHAESFIRIEYLRLDRTRQVYTGPANAFDWTQVRFAVDVMWDDDAVVDADDGQQSSAPMLFSATKVIERASSGHDTNEVSIIK